MISIEEAPASTAPSGMCGAELRSDFILHGAHDSARRVGAAWKRRSARQGYAEARGCHLRRGAARSAGNENHEGLFPNNPVTPPPEGAHQAALSAKETEIGHG